MKPPSDTVTHGNRVCGNECFYTAPAHFNELLQMQGMAEDIQEQIHWYALQKRTERLLFNMSGSYTLEVATNNGFEQINAQGSVHRTGNRTHP